MKDADWETCSTPHKMLKLLYGVRRRASERKMRLFACACVRRLWRLQPPDGLSIRAVETAERYADGGVSREDLYAAGWAAYEGWENRKRSAERDAREAAGNTTALPKHVPSDFYGFWTDAVAEPAQAAGLTPADQCDLIRELFGCGWRRPPAAADAWLSWNDGVVRKLAQEIYENRDFEIMPLLADALEEAGCADAAILGHCREPRDHVRGCWVVDLLLRKS
jgi:hypothetical protein